jgi:regulator of sigma E protease
MTTVVIFVVVLGILVFVHELGHFIVAKMCGVYVDCFSLGFGPRLLWLTVGETEYRISVIPLGGYVRMAGQFDVPEEYDQEAAERYKHIPAYRRYDAQSVPKRMAIIVAGPLMNLLFALPVAFILLVTGETQPLSFDATTIGTIVPGSPAAVAGMVPGDKIVSVGDRLVSDWDQMVGMIRGYINTETTITYKRGDERITVPVTPVLDMDKGYLGIGVQQMRRAQVATISSNSPAARSGLKEGDVVDRLFGLYAGEVSYATLIEEIHDRPDATLVFGVKQFADERYVTDSNTYETARVVCETERAGKFEYLSIYTVKGQDIFILDNDTPDNFPVNSGDRIIKINNRRFKPNTIQNYVMNLPAGKTPVLLERITGNVIKTLEKTNMVLNVQDVGRIGVGFVPATQIVKYHPLDALLMSPKLGYAKFMELMQVLKLLITRKIDLRTIAGPIGIARMTGTAAEAGFDVLLSFVLLITVNLGVLNLLPIPVLDGGHLVLLSLEAAYRKPLSTRFVLWFQKLGFIIILGLIALVIYQDIYNMLVANESIGLFLGRIVQAVRALFQ